MSNKIKKDKITIAHLFFTIWGWSMFIFASSLALVIAPVVLILSIFFDRNKVFFIYILKATYHFFYLLNFPQRTTFYRNGLKAPKKGERRIYVINHASMFDTIIMLLLPGPIKSLVKESYTKLPIIGWLAVLAGNVILKNNSSFGEQISMYMQLTSILNQGSPLVIYPEGTKSKDGKVGKFYAGTFKIALETKSDLVPVVFDSWNIIRPNKMWIRDVKHTIKILDTLKYEEFKDMTTRQISRKVRYNIIKGLIEVRDERRQKEKNYYRHIPKFVEIDNEMKEELKLLEEKL